MTAKEDLASSEAACWLDDPVHRAWLRREAGRQLDFFAPSLRADGGFDVLGWDGRPLAAQEMEPVQELHTTTRLVHSFAIARMAGFALGDSIIDAGMDFLWNAHRDKVHGGYFWSTGGQGPKDATKLAYGHVFVLLAGASAKRVGHGGADRLIADASSVIEEHYWDERFGLLRDEFTRDWQPFSTYRGMNANMHGCEAFLAAWRATGERHYLDRAGRILDFFLGKMAPAHHARIPEHYTADWRPDPDYRGNPMFRPSGTTPGHSLEFARLQLEYSLLAGGDAGQVARARSVMQQALDDAWRPDGGLVYTLDDKGSPAVRDRYWWPVTEGIGALAAFLRHSPSASDEAWYRLLWEFADRHFIDHERGGWYPELDEQGRPVERLFMGKPDLYHSLQAALFALEGPR